jgi:diketogulonate reductase-like aldo/keto reductase
MERRPFGPRAREVAVIGQGTWHLEDGDRATAIAALRRGLDLGMTHIDTAELYGAGAVEEMVGEAIAGRRAEVYLVSKVLPQNATRSGTIAACERSLRRLGTDRLDCYLLHWRGEEPLEDTFVAFERLERAGKIAGADRIACNQVLYHLRERAIEHAVLPWCEKHDITVVAYSPFGSGRFPGPRAKGGRVLIDIAAAHRATPREVALQFLVQRRLVFTIPKAARVDHTEHNARAGDLRLSAAERMRIDEAFPLGPVRAALPIL